MGNPALQTDVTAYTRAAFPQVKQKYGSSRLVYRDDSHLHGTTVDSGGFTSSVAGR